MTAPPSDLAGQFSPRYSFADWPTVCASIPKVCAGAYVVWEGPQLIYCGMSGRQIEKYDHRAKYGLVTRLESHWAGKLSGDQFCVYVANRLVIPALRQEQLAMFKTGAQTLDDLTREYIRSRLAIQHALVESSAAAHDLERLGRRGLVFGMKPLLNPLDE